MEFRSQMHENTHNLLQQHAELEKAYQSVECNMIPMDTFMDPNQDLDFGDRVFEITNS